MSDFWVSFLANISADGLIAAALYFLLTRPDEKRKARSTARQALALIRKETEQNRERASEYLAALGELTSGPMTEDQYRSIFPLHFTRGAWNAMREGGFLPATEDPAIARSLFTMNELTTIANNNLRKLELVILGDSDANLHLMARTAHESIRLLIPTIEDSLVHLAHSDARHPSPRRRPSVTSAPAPERDGESQ